MKIINAWICQINNNKVLPIFGDLLIENGIITSISEKRFPEGLDNRVADEETINVNGKVVTIPNVNFHDHIYSRLAKGLTIKGDMSNFPNILKNLWWKLDSLIDKDILIASTKLAALESLKNGVTYIIDHHSSPNYSYNSLKTISEILNEFNIRNVLCFETTDRNGKELADKGFEENINFLNNHTNDNSKSLLGLHASFTLEDNSLMKAENILKNNNWGIHVHLAEDKSDTDISKQKYFDSPTERLTKFNLLNDKSILAHGIHLDQNDFELIKESNAALVFNLDSNMNNSVGLQKFTSIPNEIPILVGTDGMHSNVAKSLKQLFLQIRSYGLSFDEAFSFIIKVFFDQQKFIKNIFHDFTNLQTGDRADMIVWNYVPTNNLSSENFWGHYVYGVLERNIDITIQKGNILLKDSKLQNVNEQDINKEIFIQGNRLTKLFNEA